MACMHARHGSCMPWFLHAMVSACHGFCMPWFLHAMIPACHGFCMPWFLHAMVPACHGFCMPWFLHINPRLVLLFQLSYSCSDHTRIENEADNWSLHCSTSNMLLSIVCCSQHKRSKQVSPHLQIRWFSFKLLLSSYRHQRQ